MPRNVDAFARHYLFIDRLGEPTGDTVADLLRAAADRLSGIGEVTVHHLDFEHTDSVHDAAVTLTVYYDRIERRRTDRFTP